jgi:hypothetical protein
MNLAHGPDEKIASRVGLPTNSFRLQRHFPRVVKGPGLSWRTCSSAPQCGKGTTR